MNTLSNLQCPISSKKMDANVARLNGFTVLAFTLTLILTEQIFFGWILVLHFFITAFTNLVSPFSWIHRKLLSLFDSKPILTDAAPKIFAASIGFVFTALIIFFHTISWDSLYTILLIMLSVCAGLEGFFSVCVGCFLYTFIRKISI
jgi:hypothetical protein